MEVRCVVCMPLQEMLHSFWSCSAWSMKKKTSKHVRLILALLTAHNNNNNNNDMGIIHDAYILFYKIINFSNANAFEWAKISTKRK